MSDNPQPLQQPPTATSEAPKMDTTQRFTPTCLIGTYAAINAVPDAYLLVDAPDCAHLKGQFIHGNHDWMSTLISISGYHRIANTALHCWKVIDKRDDQIVETLRRMAEFEGSGVVMITSMPMATIIGIDYERLVRIVEHETGKDCAHVVDKAIDGDWMDGYAETLLTLAKKVPAADARPDPKKIAIVGNLMDRNEEDHRGNVRELRRLVAGLGLEAITVWAGGEPWAQMKQGVLEASAIVSLPYARRAAKLLARRLKVPLIETRLPFGLAGTIEWLEAIGEAMDRKKEARALIERELREVMPRLEFVAPFQFLHRRLVFIGDPHLAQGFQDIADDLGAKVPFVGITARHHNGKVFEPRPGTEVLIDPRQYEFQQRFGQTGMGADLVVSANTGASRTETGYFEFGFLCYYRHALYDRPFLGFRGFLAFADDMARELLKVDLATVQSLEDAKRGVTRPPTG